MTAGRANLERRTTRRRRTVPAPSGHAVAVVDAAVPGWRWEIEFMADGGVENDPALIEDLFRVG